MEEKNSHLFWSLYEGSDDVNQVNEDLAFPHYLHTVDHTKVDLLA